MDRTIRARSPELDKIAAELRELAAEKLKTLGLSANAVSEILISPDLPDSALGLFRPDDRSIIISEELVSEGTKEDIRNIFLHELAHAVDWLLNNGNGHGASFHECCRMLGLSPGFSRSRVSLSIRERSSRREKIRKLMALSSSPFENEAAEAIRKAQKLMLEGNMEVSDREKIHTAELFSAGRLPFWAKELSSYAGSSSGAFVLTLSKPESRTIMLHGSVEEVELAIYIFDYVVSAAEREIKAQRKSGKKISKGSFICGAVDALSAKTGKTAESTALMVVEERNRALAKKLIYSDAKIRRTYSSTPIDSGSYQSGRAFGKELNIPERIRIKLIGN